MKDGSFSVRIHKLSTFSRVFGCVAIAFGLSCLQTPAISAPAVGWTGTTMLILESEGGRQMVWSYAAGVADSEKQLRKVAQKFPRVIAPNQLACVPDDVSQQQLGETVLSFLRDSPSRQQESAHSLVREAMLSAWPCARR